MVEIFLEKEIEMHKRFLWVLVFLVACGISDSTTFASTDRTNVRAAKLKAQLDEVSDGTILSVKLKDHSEGRGELVARSEESFELATPNQSQ